MGKHGYVYSSKEVEEIMAHIDLNNNGFLDYTEFLAGCMKSKIYLNEEVIKNSFRYFDIVRHKILLIPIRITTV